MTEKKTIKDIEEALLELPEGRREKALIDTIQAISYKLALECLVDCVKKNDYEGMEKRILIINKLRLDKK